MEYKLFAFLAFQINTLPLLIVSVVGVAFAQRRSDLGKRAILARRGFGMLVSAQLVAVYSSYLMSFGYDPATVAESAKQAGRLGLLNTALTTGGLAFLIAAVFHRTPTGEIAAPASQPES